MFPRPGAVWGMATPFAEDPADEFTWDDDWKEVVLDNSPSSGNFSHDGQEATLVGRIPWNMQRDAARKILGYAYADTASPWALHRELPQWHPEFPWMRAYSVSFAPYGPKKNPDSTTPSANAANRDSLFGNDPGENRVAFYEEALATVRFKAYRYLFLEDEDISQTSDEYFRYSYTDTEPSLDVLSADGSFSQLTFAEGAGSPAPTAGTTRFPAPIGVLLPKTRILVKWFSVPHEYLSESDDYFFPTKILECVGKVNSVEFMGRDIGTLLMHPPRWSIKPFPGVIAADLITPLLQVDLEIPLEYFDPPMGPASPTVRGHNNMPWRENGKFYLATRDGTVGGARLLESIDFNQIWEHVQA